MTTTPPTALQRVRQFTTVALAIVIAARAIFIICTSALAASNSPTELDLVTRGQARLACFRTAVAPSVKVGYLDEDPKSQTWFLIAQYALAPVAMEQSTNHRFIVANFPSDEDLYAYIAPTHLKTVAGFGEGRAVLENQDIAR